MTEYKNWKSLYLTFTMPISQDIAEEAFEAKFGYPPKESFNWLNKYLMVGPVKEDEDDTTNGISN